MMTWLNGQIPVNELAVMTLDNSPINLRHENGLSDFAHALRRERGDAIRCPNIHLPKSPLNPGYAEVRIDNHRRFKCEGKCDGRIKSIKHPEPLHCERYISIAKDQLPPEDFNAILNAVWTEATTVMENRYYALRRYGRLTQEVAHMPKSTVQTGTADHALHDPLPNSIERFVRGRSVTMTGPGSRNDTAIFTWRHDEIVKPVGRLLDSDLAMIDSDQMLGTFHGVADDGKRLRMDITIPGSQSSAPASTQQSEEWYKEEDIMDLESALV